MTLRKTLVILGLVGAVAAAVVAGTAFAQTPTPTPGQSGTNYQQLFENQLASALGITTDKLTSAFTTARNATVDQAVKDGKLTQQQADSIKSKPATGPGLGFGFGHFGHGPRGGMGFIGGPDVQSAIAGALGITTQELQTQLQSGKTLAQIAGGNAAAVKTAIVNTIKPKLDQAVKDNKLTQARETQIIDGIQNGDLSQFGGHWGMRPGGKGGPGTRPSMGPARMGPGAL